MNLATRCWNLFAGNLSRLITAFERHNPEALLEKEKENLRALIGRFNEGMVSHAALAERLIAQANRGESEYTALTTKVSVYLETGNRDEAARLALQRKQVESRLAEDRAELAEAERTYQSLARTRDAAVTDARDKIEAVRRQIGGLKVDRAVADLETMAAAMVGELGDAGDSLDRLQRLVAEEREYAAGRARVATDAAAAVGFAATEAEQAVLAKQALAEFLHGEGADRTAPALPSPDVHPVVAAVPPVIRYVSTSKVER